MCGAASQGARRFFSPHAPVIFQTPSASHVSAAFVVTAVRKPVQRREPKLRYAMFCCSTIFAGWNRSLGPSIEDYLTGKVSPRVFYNHVTNTKWEVKEGFAETIQALTDRGLSTGVHCGSLKYKNLSDEDQSTDRMMISKLLRANLWKHGIRMVDLNYTKNRSDINPDMAHRVSRNFEQGRVFDISDPLEVVSFDTCLKSLEAKRNLGIWTAAEHHDPCVVKRINAVRTTRPDFVVRDSAKMANFVVDRIEATVVKGGVSGTSLTFVD